jgi:hypothetical protein
MLSIVFAGFAIADGSAAADGNTDKPATKFLSPAEQVKDLAAFRAGFMDLDRAFTPNARAVAEQKLSELEGASRQTSTAEFLVALCKITAMADNAHSSCFYRSAIVTLTFSAMSGEFYVLAASPDNADLLGARLIAIDGQSITAIHPIVQSLFGGTAARKDLRAADTLSRPDLLNALDITTSPDSATYRLLTPAGQIIDRQITPSRRGASWVSLPSQNHIPWALQNPDQLFRWRDAPDLDAVVVQMRSNADATDQKIADFLEEAETARANLGRKNVVLDMRENVGGDFLTTRDFMLSWPKRIPSRGRFFVLTGPATFSAGIASVAYLKQAAGDRAILVGEPPGDRLTFFAEGNLMQLPSSGVAVLAATQRDDFATGCRGYSDCMVVLAQPGSPTGTPADLAAILDDKFGRRPLSIRSLDPDLRAPWTIADYTTGHDPAMEAVTTYLQTH